MKRIALLGSTGSIGENVLAIVRQFPHRYQVTGLAAGTNINLLARQIEEFQPRLVSVIDEAHAEALQQRLPAHWTGTIHFGTHGNCAVASEAQAEMVVTAMVGAAGLLPTLAAIEQGKDIGLANKETLVMAGRLVMAAVRNSGVKLLPIDSEHSAIFQALEAGRREDVARIILTASGGPFLGKDQAALNHVTTEQALAHPTWTMGKKISIDSATLMNKGLEVIEARWLFDMDGTGIKVVVHPQSIVHSLVEYQDGSVMAQLGIPDMKIPIAYALSYPERLGLKLEPLNLGQCGNLAFMEPDYARFPALRLAFEALARGGISPAVLNGANEVAVQAFLDQQITFTQIPMIVGEALELVRDGDDLVLDDLLGADSEARSVAQSLIHSY